MKIIIFLTQSMINGRIGSVLFQTLILGSGKFLNNKNLEKIKKFLFAY